MPSNEPSRQGRPPRLQSAPPPLISTGESFEAQKLLDENPAAQAVLLWQSLRDVFLWASASEHQRGQLFSDGAANRRLNELKAANLDDPLCSPLLVLAGMLRNDTSVAEDDLAAACRQISQWADQSGRTETAIISARAAAALLPHDAEAAYAVGLLYRRQADYNRAEAWVRRAIGLARRKDLQTYAWAFVALGNVYMQRGQYSAAYVCYMRAVRAARRRRMRRVRAVALHDLIGVAFELKRTAEAESYIQKAARAYSASDPRLPALAHDVARYWMLQGSFGRALVVFQAVLPLIERPAEQLIVLSGVARSAAGAGRRDVFLQAWTDAWRMIDRDVSTEWACSAILNLAYASALLDDWERVGVAAQYAYEQARGRGERTVQVEAEALLRAAEQRTFAPTPAYPEAEAAVAETADLVAAGLVRKLAAHARAKRD